MRHYPHASCSCKRAELASCEMMVRVLLFQQKRKAKKQEKIHSTVASDAEMPKEASLFRNDRRAMPPAKA